MNKRERIAAVVTGVALSAGSVLTFATPAHAFPTSCVTTQGETGGSTKCLTGTGQYQVVVLCRKRGHFYTETGRWVDIGENSIVFCNGGVAKDATVYFR